MAQQDLTDAIEKTILGSERQMVMSDEDRERTAYHESGHALVGMLTAGVLAHALLEHETLDQPEAYGVADVTPGATERDEELTPARA